MSSKRKEVNKSTADVDDPGYVLRRVRAYLSKPLPATRREASASRRVVMMRDRSSCVVFGATSSDSNDDDSGF